MFSYLSIFLEYNFSFYIDIPGFYILHGGGCVNRKKNPVTVCKQPVYSPLTRRNPRNIIYVYIYVYIYVNMYK